MLTPGTRYRAIRSSRLQEGKGMPAGKTAGSRLRSIVSCFGSLGAIKCAQPMNNVAQNNSAILLYESFGLFMMSLHYRRTCRGHRSEEHTSELQSLMRSSYADCCLKKKRNY